MKRGLQGEPGSTATDKLNPNRLQHHPGPEASSVIWADVPLPTDPVERIRALRVLRQVYVRGRSPRVRATFRRSGRRTHGPYMVASFPRTLDHPGPKVMYLGKPETESVAFVEWLSRMSDGSAFRLARLAIRQLGTALSTLRRVPSGVETVVRVLASVFELEPGEEPDEPPLGPVAEVLGPWRAGFSRLLRSMLD